MNMVLIACLAAAMLATLGVLVVGMVAMVKGGEFNRKYGNKLMNARVILQGVALFFLALVILNSQ